MARKKNADAEVVAARTVEVETGEATTNHLKTFTVLKRDWNDGEVREGFHDDNIVAARTYLINQGLRPSESGSFVGAEEFDKNNVLLTYEIGSEPAERQVVKATLDKIDVVVDSNEGKPHEINHRVATKVEQVSQENNQEKSE